MPIRRASSFDKDRVVVHVHTRAKLGTGVYGSCVGVSLTRDVDVSDPSGCAG